VDDDLHRFKRGVARRSLGAPQGPEPRVPDVKNVPNLYGANGTWSQGTVRRTLEHRGRIGASVGAHYTNIRGRGWRSCQEEIVLDHVEASWSPATLDRDV